MFIMMLFLKCIIQDDNFKIGIICLFRLKTNSWFLECANRNFLVTENYTAGLYIIKKNSLLYFAFILHLSTVIHIISALLNFLAASRVTLVLIALRILFGLPQEAFQYCVFLSTERRLVSLEVVAFQWGGRWKQETKEQKFQVRLEVLLEELFPKANPGQLPFCF